MTIQTMFVERQVPCKFSKQVNLMKRLKLLIKARGPLRGKGKRAKEKGMFQKIKYESINVQGK
jgi:hypothetical protein